MTFKICLFICLWFQLTRWSSCENISVKTNVGTIKGLRASDGDYNMFMGIPYGMVDDSNPFGPPRPYPSFQEEFEAYDDSSKCPQLNQYSNTITGSLDCLRLNIFVPSSLTSTDNLAVMFWVSGGSFSSCDSGRDKYGPSYLVRQNVIVITLNYRVGPYGFMCLDIPEVSGNQGLKDQYLALQWVKNNIEAFGGDPNRITGFGVSAGGHSIDLHMMSTKDVLFNNIILQSGSALSVSILYEPDKLAAIKIASIMGFQTNDTREALLFLSTSNTNLVTEASVQTSIQFKPCVENIHKSIDPYITNSWINIKSVPKIKDVPVLMGFNRHELGGWLFKNDLNNPALIDNYLYQAFDFSDDEFDTMKTIISHKYYGDETEESTKWGLIRFASDILYIHPVYRTMKIYIENDAANIYFYVLSYLGGRNILITDTYDEGDGMCCASHSDEVPYLFTRDTKPAPTATDELMIDRMTTMWTNFAKYSDPTPEETALLPVKWQPVTRDVYHYLDIDKDFSTGRRPLYDRMAFWDLFYEHNYKKQRLYVEE